MSVEQLQQQIKDAHRKRGVRALCILLCVAGATTAAAFMWGGWAALFTFCGLYGAVCLHEE